MIPKRNSHKNKAKNRSNLDKCNKLKQRSRVDKNYLMSSSKKTKYSLCLMCSQMTLINTRLRVVTMMIKRRKIKGIMVVSSLMRILAMMKLRGSLVVSPKTKRLLIQMSRQINNPSKHKFLMSSLLVRPSTARNTNNENCFYNSINLHTLLKKIFVNS